LDQLLILRDFLRIMSHGVVPDFPSGDDQVMTKVGR